MKKIQLALCIGVAIILFSCSSTRRAASPETKNEEAERQLAHFPKARTGFKRYVILLPAEKEEAGLKLELTAGKVMPTDCNTRSLNGKIAEKELKGWGYNYYEFTTNGTVVSTMMACPDDKKVEKFVGARPELIRYNSKLPVVVFVPEGYQLQYRVWSAGSAVDAQEK